ncbi:filamentous haemagglutinin family protein [Herbaspirillum robiniae]|uniref:filamentous haemagglutinin family protein n=1 Tax=Herbaspirillum robiniae TaxID=2014887 RepID=UPI003D78039C
MSKRKKAIAFSQAYSSGSAPAFQLAPIAGAAAIFIGLSVAQPVLAQQAFSPAWFASKGAAQSSAAATGYLPNGVRAATVINPTQQQQAANAQLQRSINNLSLLARGIAAQQAAQEAARQAALANGGSVPDGLAEGGLKVDTNSLTQGWINANAPTQSSANGKTIVSVAQTADKAILNWETFNVGKNTILNFAQQAGWAVLNRVNDPLARPSQIQGQINAPGTVMIANRNGVVFTGSSQVDTRNLVVAAANISDAQFRDNGIYSSGTQASFADAFAGIDVQAGARINTAVPESATQGGGYVLLLGGEVHNGGAINAVGGQVMLAAGNSFFIKKGLSTDGNPLSSTRGNEVTPTFNNGASGIVRNDGLLTAATGDITLSGLQVSQNGVALSSTSVSTRGTVHLTAGGGGTVSLGATSATAVVLEDSAAGALDSQRTGLMTPVGATTGIVATDGDRRDLSRVEITSGGDVDFGSGSLTLATGGQIAVSAVNRSLVRDAAILDVSGAVGVNLAMSSNNIKINVQGNEQRDASVNRDSTLLNSSDVWIDTRSLIYVPAGTNGYATDRWYTAGGLLEVSGYLGTQTHTIGEWMASGGGVSFAGGDVVTQKDSVINLSGGSINVATGTLRQTWLKGADGRLYEVSKAPGDLLYSGVYKGFEVAHARWGTSATEYFANPLIAPTTRLEDGYTVGRDAGRLLISTKSAVLEGQIVAETFQGSSQTALPQASLDGYRQPQSSVARGAQLVVGSYTPYFNTSNGSFDFVLGADGNTVASVTLGSATGLAAGIDLGTAIGARQGQLTLDTRLLSGFGLGALKIAALGGIRVDDDVQLASGGDLVLMSNNVQVNAGLIAHGGSIQLGNVLAQTSINGVVDGRLSNGMPVGNVTLGAGAVLDVSGLWSNLLADDGSSGNGVYRNGGRVSIRATRDISLALGSIVNAESGATLQANGVLKGGTGGNVSLLAGELGDPAGGELQLAGTVSGYGVEGGGSLTLQSNRIQVGSGNQGAPGTDTLLLDAAGFNKGFARYALIGNKGIAVAGDAMVDVTMPVVQVNVADWLQSGDAAAAGVRRLWLPVLYADDPAHAVITQRKGASISLQAGTRNSGAADVAAVAAVIGRGATLQVDPGQSIGITSIGQLTVDGVLRASGGSISLLGQGKLVSDTDTTVVHDAGPAGRSIWIGDNAVLDVAAQAVTAVNANGVRYGLVGQGGSIVVGGTFDVATGTVTTSDQFVVVRNGALLDASGTQATLDLLGRTTEVASAGGSITLASNSGLYLDGTLRARAGGAGVAGGTLNIALETPLYSETASAAVRLARELVVSQSQTASAISAGSSAAQAAAGLTVGHAGMAVSQVTSGGFDNLALLSNGVISFDGNVDLALGQSLGLYANSLALTDAASAASRVTLAAPYVTLAGVTARGENLKIQPTVHGGVSQQQEAGQLTINAGRLLELRDKLTIGAQLNAGTTTDKLAVAIDRRAFDQVNLASQGDLRFLAAITGAGATTNFTTPGDLSLLAAQIYPATNATAVVNAGYLGVNSDFDPARALVIGRTTSDTPTLPYSVFGSLSLQAATIEQGGVLRAPLGSLTLGTAASGGTRLTRRVDLLPGSLTSVSAAGLVMPYGGTVDGLIWQFGGNDVSPLAQGGTNATGGMVIGLSTAAAVVDVQSGAVVDLSGGGKLTGAAFVSGRGGSTDARMNPLVQNLADGSFRLPSLATNPVYAIVPGVQTSVAPGGAGGAVQPLAGQQITIGAGVPGLAAGTYTLLPSTYALLPGAFRVELNGLAASGAAAVQSMRNGSWATNGTLSVAATGILDQLARQVVVTPADVLRRYSQFNETSYADFVRADALRVGVPRGALEADAKTWALRMRQSSGHDIGFIMDGSINFAPASGGAGGTLAVLGQQVEILGAGANPLGDGTTVSVYAGDLNAAGAARLSIGSTPQIVYGQGGNIVTYGGASGSSATVTLRSGAVLSAPEVLLVSSSPTGGITIEGGASINTLGRGKVPYDSSDGFIYQPNYNSVVAVSNGNLQMLAPFSQASQGPGSITIGQCTALPCTGVASLYSEGSINFATDKSFALDDSVLYGTRNLTLAVGRINVGTPAALAAAAAGNALAPGLTFNQDVMTRLLRGDTSTGAPAMENLLLTAGQSMNFFGDVTLSTLDANGRSSLKNLVLTTPAIYGYGDAASVARIQTGSLVWNGATSLPGEVVANGAGTGSGSFAIDAQRIEFGYASQNQADGAQVLGRLALGFSNVNLSASERITANNKNSLSVYQAQGAYDPVTGYSYSGGNLNIVTPLLTGAAGSVNRITAGGAINVTAPASGVAQSTTDAAALGAELALIGDSVHVDTAVVLPSGKLTLSAAGDLTLGAASKLDLSGRKVSFNDVDKYSWGGDLILESSAGSIRQAAAAEIDLSAQFNRGGSLKATAVGATAGTVALEGSIKGAASGYYDAGGTLVPYLGAYFELHAQNLGGDLDTQFAALNERLNAGAVFGARSFQLKQGSLTVGNGVKANTVDISIDNGSLTVTGAIDASGASVGSIRLAGQHGLTLAGSALLDAHGTVLRVDSYGKIIDSPNRATIELNSGNGLLTLADGAAIDLRHGTGATIGSAAGQARGLLELYAPRIGSDGLPTNAANASGADAATYGDIAVDASGALRIVGAKSIALNASQRYDDAPLGTVKDASGNVVLDANGIPVVDTSAGGRPYQVIDQNYLDAKHGQSTTFIGNALNNADLLSNKLAGLNNAAYAGVFHLRPAVEIVSNAQTNPQGDMVVSGDLDLSGYRYASLNANTQKTGIYGSGEPGSLIIRAAGNLDIYGSITDGFAPPAATPDDKGWVLVPGIQPYSSDVVVPGSGVVLDTGTRFPAGRTLNYAIPIQAVTLASGTVLPAAASLTAPLQLAANTVLRGDVRDGSGNLLYAAGTILSQAVSLPAGTSLGAGTVLPAAAALAAFTWPAGVPLPSRASYQSYDNPDGVFLASSLALKVGALIPSFTDVKLPNGALSTPLRTVTGGSQGKNWAIAAMLPEGSQSWSMRLVAGADLAAADTRATRPQLAGSITLADTHYQVYEVHDKTIIPGTPAQPGGAWYWSQEGADTFGETANTPISADWGNFCDDSGSASFCTRVNYTYNDIAALIDPSVTEGAPVPASLEARWCPELCNPVGTPTPAIPEQVIIGAVNRIAPLAVNYSVVRTGTGSLDVIAARDVTMRSAYGVYTAGTSTASLAGAAAADYNRGRAQAGDGTVLGAAASAYESLVNGGNGSTYAAWYPDLGGNLLVRTGGNLSGDVISGQLGLGPQDARVQGQSANVSNWLWRQGSGATAGVDPIATSWWINFGTYVSSDTTTNSSQFPKDYADMAKLPVLVGFTGIGTLGGGNLTVDVGGDAGMLNRLYTSGTPAKPRSEALVLAVGSSGRVGADGQMMLTGGGDLNLRIGGGLNPVLTARAELPGGGLVPTNAAYAIQNLNVNGVLTDLRGALSLQSGTLGGIALNYGANSAQQDAKEGRAFDPFRATLGTATGGVTLMLGDATANLATRGDLVLSGTSDPGSVLQVANSAFTYNGNTYVSGGQSWFSLWTDHTAINLLAAGGNLAPSTQLNDVGISVATNLEPQSGRFMFPSQLSVVAANGSIYLGKSALGQVTGIDLSPSIVLAPSASGKLEMLAADSIYAGGYAIERSGALPGVMATPQHAAFYGNVDGTYVTGNLDANAASPSGGLSPLAFGIDSAAQGAGAVVTPSLFYARDGDIVGLTTGQILSFGNGSRLGQVWYEAGSPVWMMAGRDIVNSGTALGQPTMVMDNGLGNIVGKSPNTSWASVTGNLFVHNNDTDVSLVSAGRDIIHSSFNVAGPGTLEVTAGRNILMEDKASVASIGPVVSGDARPGANLVMQAGAGGVDYAGFLQRYLDPANQAVAGTPLANQAGKVVQVYSGKLTLADWLRKNYAYAGNDNDAQAFLDQLQAKRDADASQPRRILVNDYQQAAKAYLVNWLEARYGFDGSEDALTYFNRLAPEQQRIYARNVYFAEITASGREYNAVNGVRTGSYLRGRNAIAALFPASGDGGDIIMYGSGGINTLFGGDIQMLTPDGKQVLGVEGAAPQVQGNVVPGVVTQGSGDIDLYAQGSLLLGQSRIMTTFGGSVMAWSASGDINAGRGSKTTVVYTPPKRVYDQWGDVTLSSNVPSTGAGIATLAPIPEVPAGDIDLIAPLGTIDAGEAGIRVSGNVNIAALQVVNAANIQVQGKSTGLPVVAAVNVGALTNASAAASSAAVAAQDAVARDRAAARQNLPSVFTVRVLGFGNDGASVEPVNGSGRGAYNNNSPVQVLGQGPISDLQQARLTDEEKRLLRR